MLKHRFIGRSAVFLAVVATAVLTAAGAANAANPPNNLPHYGKSGVAGYEYTANHALNNLTAVINPDATFVNIGAVGVGGAGVQDCDPNNGYAAQLGLVATGPSTESVDYQAGVLGGCADFGVLQNPLQVNAALSSIPLGDSVQVWMSHHDTTVTTGTKGHWKYGREVTLKNGHRRWERYRFPHWIPSTLKTVTVTKILFQAQDVTSNGEVFSKTITAPGKEYFDSTGVGVQQDTTGMSACTPTNTNVWDLPNGSFLNGVAYTTPTPAGAAIDGTCNLVVDFDGLSADGINLFHSASPAAEWVTSAGASPANPVTVGPGPVGFNRFAGGSFTVFAGNATS